MRETEITVQVFDKLEEIEKILTQKGYHKKEEFCLFGWNCWNTKYEVSKKQFTMVC